MAASTAVSPAVPRAEQRSPRWAAALTSIAFFMVALDALVVITALPAIHRDLGASLSTLEWTVNAYTLAYAAGIITAAAVGDRWLSVGLKGRRAARPGQTRPRLSFPPPPRGVPAYLVTA